MTLTTLVDWEGHAFEWFVVNHIQENSIGGMHKSKLEHMQNMTCPLSLRLRIASLESSGVVSCLDQLLEVYCVLKVL